MSSADDFIVDGKPISELRVVDLKTQLEKRGLSKSGQKNVLAKRLREVRQTLYNMQIFLNQNI